MRTRERRPMRRLIPNKALSELVTVWQLDPPVQQVTLLVSLGQGIRREFSGGHHTYNVELLRIEWLVSRIHSADTEFARHLLELLQGERHALMKSLNIR